MSTPKTKMLNVRVTKALAARLEAILEERRTRLSDEVREFLSQLCGFPTDALWCLTDASGKAAEMPDPKARRTAEEAHDMASQAISELEDLKGGLVQQQAKIIDQLITRLERMEEREREREQAAKKGGKR